MARAGGGRRASAAAAAAATPEAVEALLDRWAHALPRCVVWDLDYCIWNCWCEMHSARDTAPIYPDVPAILAALGSRGIKMALASRTPTPDVASAWLDQTGMRQQFQSIQLIPAADGCDQHSAQKDTCHFPNIQRELSIPYSDMLFFDDEHNNIRKVSRLGVVSILVHTSTGVCLASLEEGLKAFADAKQAAEA